MLLVPSVAINGTIPITVIVTAFNTPQRIPANNPINIAGNTGIDEFNDIAVIIPAIADTEPIDRSIPPVIIT